MEFESATVKVMNSYDYCHFEVCLSLSDAVTEETVDETRKEAQRLVDKAIDQYKIGKLTAKARIRAEQSAAGLRKEVNIIKENFPKSEWTPEQKAKVKALDDYDFRASLHYDYEDDWDYDRDEY
jgi:arginine decarboxylase-like protein